MISIYCSEKLDGVAAAAIVMRHATLSKLPCHFGGFLHQDLLAEELEDMAKQDKQLIFVLDISLSPDHLPLLEKISKNNQLVYWNTYDKESVVPEVKIFDNKEGVCSAELAKERFLPEDKVAGELAKLAKEVKFWQVRDERAAKLADLIAAQHNPIELIETLSKGLYWNDKLEEAHKTYSEKKEAALDSLLKELQIKAYLNNRFGFSLASPILNTADACEHILKGHAGVDVAVVLFKDGKIGFRRRDDCEVNVEELAKLFDGGGKPFAAGARLNNTVTKENLPEVLFELDQVFKNYFVK